MPQASPTSAPASSSHEPFLACEVAGEAVAVPLELVQEVTPAATLAGSAGQHRAWMGYLDLRGVTVPVFDGRALLGLPSRALRPSDRFIVLHADTARVALRVDAVEGIEQVVPMPRPAGRSPDGPGLPPGRRLGGSSGPRLVGIVDGEAIRKLRQGFPSGTPRARRSSGPERSSGGPA